MRQCRLPTLSFRSNSVAIVGKPEVEEWFRRAASLRAEGKPNAALEACEYVLSIEPHHVAALSVRAHSLRMLNRYSEAESAARRAIECNGEYPAA